MKFVKLGRLVFNAGRKPNKERARIGNVKQGWFARPLFWRFWWATR